MTKRIFRSICLVAISVFLASVTLFMCVLYSYFSTVQQNQLKMQTHLALQGVEHEGIEYLKDLDINDYRITWIDKNGTVLYDSKSDYDEMENHLQREEVKQALADGVGESSRYSSTLTEKFLYCAERLTDGTVIRLSVAQNTILTLILGMSQPIAIIFVIAVVLSFALASALSKKIVKPLEELDLDKPLNNKSYEELSPLLNHIDNQQKKIKKQRGKLKQKENEFENERIKTEQMRREFTANVSHELKTPLHTISGCSELLSNGMVKQEDVEKFSKQIYTETQRMINLVEDIIKLSQLDEGAENMQYEIVDLYSVAENVLDRLQSEAEKAGVTLSLDGEAAKIKAVPQLINIIIFNLCDNAIKYNKKNGLVNVEIKNEDNNAVLSVSDTGIGIPAEHQERIFERFYRVDKSHSKAVGGTGLGLSIVKHAAMLHHAEIELESTLDKGTKITLKFPK